MPTLQLTRIVDVRAAPAGRCRPSASLPRVAAVRQCWASSPALRSTANRHVVCSACILVAVAFGAPAASLIPMLKKRLCLSPAATTTLRSCARWSGPLHLDRKSVVFATLWRLKLAAGAGMRRRPYTTSKAGLAHDGVTHPRNEGRATPRHRTAEETRCHLVMLDRNARLRDR